MNNLSVKDIIYANGCLDDLNIPVIDKSYLDYALEVSDLYRGDSYVQMTKRKSSLRECRIILDRLLKLHNIYHMDKKGLYNFLHSVNLDENKLTVEELKSVFDKVNEFGSYINPYDLKVSFVKYNGLLEGELISSLFDTIEDDKITLVVSFDKINLARQSTIITPCVYAHELVHSQLQSNRGIVKYYENLECLSYFIEFVVALETSCCEDVLKLMEKFINIEIIKIVDELNSSPLNEDDDYLYDIGKYLFSTIKALKLFIIYYSGSELLKKEMLLKVQKVFDGEMYLEDLLDEFSIDSKIDKCMIKHLSR